MKLERIMIAGAGGQGIIFLGKLLANAALDAIPHVTYFPAYGIEVRGGAANCQVILSSDEISSPVADQVDALIVMNQESLDKFIGRIAPKGLAVVNSSLCMIDPAPGRVLVPATAKADQLGDARMANMIMLGAFLARHPVLTVADIEATLRNLLDDNPGAIERNLAALRLGMQSV